MFYKNKIKIIILVMFLFSRLETPLKDGVVVFWFFDDSSCDRYRILTREGESNK